MSFEELEIRVIAYLMNELGEQERADFEAEMVDDESVAALVDEIERSMGLTMLTNAELVEPAMGLRDRLLEAIPEEESASDEASSSIDPTEPVVAPFPYGKVVLGVVGWAVAACLLVVYFGQSDNMSDLKTEKDDLLAKNQSLQEKADELLEVASSRADRNRELETQIETTIASNETLQSKVEELTEMAETTQQAKMQLETAIASIRSTNQTLRSQLEQLTVQLASSDSQREILESSVTNLRQQSVLDKIQIAALSSENDELRYGFAVWDNERDSGIVKVYNMQTLDTLKQDYQCWVISPDQEAPIPAGVFQVDNQGRADFAFSPSVSVSAAGAFAISLEPKGGSVSPTGPIMLSGAL